MSKALRIRIALDHGPFNRSAMEWVMQMAEQLQAPLDALFIEDEQLFQIAALPFTRQISGGGTGQRLDPESLAREMLQQARQLERQLRDLTQASDIPLSFSRVRGRLREEIRRAGEEVGVLVVQGRRAGPRGNTVMAVFDGSEAAAAVVGLALRSVPAEALHLLIQADTREQAATLREQVAELMAREGVEQIRSSYLPVHDGRHLVRLAELEHPAAIFVAGGNSLLTDHSLNELTEALPCPLAIVGRAE